MHTKYFNLKALYETWAFWSPVIHTDLHCIHQRFICSSSIALFPIKALIEFVHLLWQNIFQRIGNQVSHFRCHRIFNSIPNDVWTVNGQIAQTDICAQQSNRSVSLILWQFSFWFNYWEIWKWHCHQSPTVLH